MRRLLASSLALALALAPGVAVARSEKSLAYQREQVWPTAVRFLVVDEHVKVIEKDADAGYVLFQYRDEGKTYRGSLEVMTTVRDKRTLVRFVVQIEDRPSYVEAAMLERLERKLRAELGSPAPAPTPPRDAPKDTPKDTPKDPPKDAPKDDGPAMSPTP
jgi:hypothetical protein